MFIKNKILEPKKFFYKSSKKKNETEVTETCQETLDEYREKLA